MGFMQQQVVKDSWATIEDAKGETRVVPLEYFLDAISEAITEQSDCIISIEIQHNKWGARLSAPGYLDCTEWSVFDTEEEAKDFLEETYPEEDGS